VNYSYIEFLEHQHFLSWLLAFLFKVYNTRLGLRQSIGCQFLKSSVIKASCFLVSMKRFRVSNFMRIFTEISVAVRAEDFYVPLQLKQNFFILFLSTIEPFFFEIFTLFYLLFSFTKLLEWNILYRLFGNNFLHDTYSAKVLEMKTVFQKKTQTDYL